MFRHQGTILRDLQNKGLWAQQACLGIPLHELKFLQDSVRINVTLGGVRATNLTMEKQ